ncbi:hypothetical protein HCN44_005774 [Aphidius gifuensis]|uniref:Uncharacterized protein n=2 Tax=Aphidius gifuensis TaxID=684658 RepID=A0A834XUY4_APHGI|nr:hypothetical protein HCN44_005774 [Aphidius gifuensis]
MNLLFRNLSYSKWFLTRGIADYVQGQSPEARVREYFYYIDHNGMLFLDDARMKNFTSCFKEKKFLNFFFKRLKINDSNRYTKDFPYLSLCGKERNFIRCDDLPIVFTHVINDSNSDNELFSYAYADDLLVVPFQPSKICMNIKTGRVYHPASEKIGGIGLVKSKFAIELSPYFEFTNGEDKHPTHLTWRGKRFVLDSQWYHDKLKLTKNIED